MCDLIRNFKLDYILPSDIQYAWSTQTAVIYRTFIYGLVAVYKSFLMVKR